jgi:hypothetical protein
MVNSPVRSLCAHFAFLLPWAAMLSLSGIRRGNGLAEKPMVRETRYLSYLLRLWQQGGGEGSQWRASLESPHGGDRMGFASLADLFAFLENETGSSSPGLERTGDEGRR